MLLSMLIPLKQPNTLSQKQIKILLPEQNERINTAIQKLRQNSSYELFHQLTTEQLKLCKETISQSLQTKKLSDTQISHYENHLGMQSAAALKQGFMDAVVIGSEITTADVIRSGLWLKLKSSNLISSCFLMVHPQTHKVILFADCGVNAEPDDEQLAEIATQSLTTWRILQDESPKIAFLSFSTKGSAKHAVVEKVQQASALFQKQHPHELCDGELQFDAAWDPDIRKRKSPDSKLTGQANCFIFPDLNSGNIAYKITQQLAGYHAFGPILQGFSKPLMDLSRGSTVEDIVYTAKIAGALAHNTKQKNHEDSNP